MSSERRAGASAPGVYDMEADTAEGRGEAASLPDSDGADEPGGRTSGDAGTDAPKSGDPVGSGGPSPAAAARPDPGAALAPDAESGAPAATSETARSNVEDIFARLRSISEKFSADAPIAGSAQPAGAAAPPPAAARAGSTHVTASDAPSSVVPTPASTGPVAVERDDARDDATAAAGAAAVKEITRDLRRMIMDDQSELVDAIRRLGRRAIMERANTDDSSYVGALRQPLQRFVSDIDASIDDLNLKAAAAAIVSTLGDPVRARLRELAEDTGNTADELNARVRAIFGESRARHAPAAAEAAFAAAWPELEERP